MVSMTMIFLSTKIRFSLFCLLFIGIWLFPLSASANAMPSTWAGTGGLELWVAEDCPVEVERERLTLRLDGARVGAEDCGRLLLALSPTRLTDGGGYCALIGT